MFGLPSFNHRPGLPPESSSPAMLRRKPRAETERRNTSGRFANRSPSMPSRTLRPLRRRVWPDSRTTNCCSHSRTSSGECACFRSSGAPERRGWIPAGFRSPQPHSILSVIIGRGDRSSAREEPRDAGQQYPQDERHYACEEDEPCGEGTAPPPAEHHEAQHGQSESHNDKHKISEIQDRSSSREGVSPARAG